MSKDLIELTKKNIKEIRKALKSVKNVTFELNSLTMEIPYISEENINQDVMKKLTEKLRIIYSNTDDIFSEARKMENIIARDECKEYIKQINIYVNALAVLIYLTFQYITSFCSKFGQNDDIDNMYTYYLYIAQTADLLAIDHQKLIINLGEEYYE